MKCPFCKKEMIEREIFQEANFRRAETGGKGGFQRKNRTQRAHATGSPVCGV